MNHRRGPVADRTGIRLVLLRWQHLQCQTVGNSTQQVPAGSQGFSTQLDLNYGSERLPSRTRERKWDYVLSSVLASVLILSALQVWTPSQTVSPNPALHGPLTSCMRPAASTRGLILDSDLLLWVSHTLTPAPFYRQLSSIWSIPAILIIIESDWVCSLNLTQCSTLSFSLTVNLQLNLSFHHYCDLSGFVNYMSFLAVVTIVMSDKVV